MYFCPPQIQCRFPPVCVLLAPAPTRACAPGLDRSTVYIDKRKATYLILKGIRVNNKLQVCQTAVAIEKVFRYARLVIDDKESPIRQAIDSIDTQTEFDSKLVVIDLALDVGDCKRNAIRFGNQEVFQQL
jgi:hypothetical protein